MILVKLKSKRASGMVIACFVLLLLFALGLSFLGVASSALITAKSDVLRVRAMAAAEAGVELASTYLLDVGPSGEENGTWRTFTGPANTHDPNHAGCNWYWAPSTLGLPAGETFKICVRDGSGPTAGKVIVTSVGIVTQAGRTVTRTIKVVLDYDAENVCVWNNVIFGGVGQLGKSINGNVRMRGSVHLLGDGEDFTDVDSDGHWDDNEWYMDANHNGAYDLGEPFDDVDLDGRRDAREPFKDVNGNGKRDPALTVTDLAFGEGGTADVGTNYNGMPGYHGAEGPVNLAEKIPALEKDLYNGENVESLGSKLRVKHGMVSIQGSAVVGYPDVTGPSGNPDWAVKETVDGTYVSDGFTGSPGAGSVYSDNGHSNGYDLGDGLVQMPVVSDPYGGYGSYMEWYKAGALVINGSQTWDDTSSAFAYSDALGNSVSFDPATGSMVVTGKVYIEGTLHLGSTKVPTVTYTGRGTLATSGDIHIHSNVLPSTKFPCVTPNDDPSIPADGDVLGLMARRKMWVANGPGDSQLTMAMAMYAQEQITIGKQCEIAGTLVSSYFDMKNVPHIYQVPELQKKKNLPPGMPGGDPIYIKSLDVESWQEQ